MRESFFVIYLCSRDPPITSVDPHGIGNGSASFHSIDLSWNGCLARGKIICYGRELLVIFCVTSVCMNTHDLLLGKNYVTGDLPSYGHADLVCLKDACAGVSRLSAYCYGRWLVCGMLENRGGVCWRRCAEELNSGRGLNLRDTTDDTSHLLHADLSSPRITASSVPVMI